MDFGTTVTTHGTVTVVAIEGEIDLQTSSVLDDALRPVDGDVVIDLTACTFLDSTALGVLVGADNRARARGRTMSLVCSNPRLLRILRITKLDTVWTVHADVAGALGVR